MGKKKKRKNKKKRRARSDKYDLYQRSVQEPESDVSFVNRVFRRRFGRPPRVLREDFCGTALFACAWVSSHKENQAWGIDLDPEPLAWGRAHNLAQLEEDAQERVSLFEGDVRTVLQPRADVLAAENFSYWVFRTRDELRAYFEIARENVADDGIMVVDLMGGSECYIENDPDVRKYKGFRYRWEMDAFDPISHDTRHYIHFDFKDGSHLEKAFVYEWRFWTLPEVRELLHEAGFAKTTVYWEGEDEDGEGNDEYEPVDRGSCDPSWIAYIVAER